MAKKKPPQDPTAKIRLNSDYRATGSRYTKLWDPEAVKPLTGVDPKKALVPVDPKAKSKKP